jgi:hypothetical protein
MAIRTEPFNAHLELFPCSPRVSSPPVRTQYVLFVAMAGIAQSRWGKFISIYCLVIITIGTLAVLPDAMCCIVFACLGNGLEP